MRCAAVFAIALNCLTSATPSWFVDVTDEVGISGGGQCAWADYDGDGWVDALIGGRLFRNIEGGHFEDVTQAAGLSGLGALCTWGDSDNDGDLDLVCSTGAGALWINNGDGTFSDGKAGLPDLPTVNSRGVAWADLNGDGLLDLYIGGYETWEKAVYPDAIYLNQGDNRFLEHWREAEGQMLSARGVTAADFDEDGDMDVYVSNYRLQPNMLWRNDGGMKLTDVAFEYGAAGNPKDVIDYTGGVRYPMCGHTIGSAWGDLDNDGHLDLFVGNFSHPPDYQDRPQFLRNTGPPDWHFEDMSTTAGLRWQESYASPALADFDNDGDLDLLFTTVYEGDRSVLYRNDGGWRFTEVTGPSGIVTERTYQAAWADFDNDGDLDLMSGGRLWRNDVASGHWLKVRVGGPGSGIGAQVRITIGGRTLTRQVESATGEGNQSEMTLHFGLGEHADPVELQVTWPGGATRTIATDVDRLVAVAPE